MKINWTAKKLNEFSEEIAKLYDEGKIKAPIHLCGSLYGDQEKALIKIFKEFKDGDWVFSFHRSHWHFLLSGKNPEDLKQQILDGKSMHVSGDKFFVSGILAGQAPIALGVAMALKRKRSKNKVWCFIGDMSGTLGLIRECLRYAEGFDLPITFVCEDNGFSVNTVTKDVWGKNNNDIHWQYYKYERTKWGHHGTGKWVLF